MGTYGRIPIENGEQLLVQRDSYRVRQGESRVYLPGDIHDTKCISSSVLMLRLTSVDLKERKKKGGKDESVCSREIRTGLSYSVSCF